MNNEVLDALETVLIFLAKLRKDPAYRPNDDERASLAHSDTILKNYYMLRAEEQSQWGRIMIAAICGAVGTVLFFLPEIIRGGKEIWWN